MTLSRFLQKDNPGQANDRLSKALVNMFSVRLHGIQAFDCRPIYLHCSAQLGELELFTNSFTTVQIVSRHPTHTTNFHISCYQQLQHFLDRYVHRATYRVPVWAHYQRVLESGRFGTTPIGGGPDIEPPRDVC